MDDTLTLPWDDSVPEVWRKATVGPGWIGLLQTLDRDLREIAPEYRVLQVKEKFGGLRFYATGLPAYGTPSGTEARTRIAISEAASERICEECGKPGQLRGELIWVRTLCDGCLAKVKEGRNDS